MSFFYTLSPEHIMDIICFIDGITSISVNNLAELKFCRKGIDFRSGHGKTKTWGLLGEVQEFNIRVHGLKRNLNGIIIILLRNLKC